jgi:hypothetical protein
MQHSIALLLLGVKPGQDDGSKLHFRPRSFELSGLSLDMFGQPLTDSWFPGGDGENGPPVTATGAHTWPAMANAETNGETESAQNVGQLGTCG